MDTGPTCSSSKSLGQAELIYPSATKLNPNKQILMFLHLAAVISPNLDLLGRVL